MLTPREHNIVEDDRNKNIIAGNCYVYPICDYIIG